MAGGVFVSYKRDDARLVRRVVDALRAEGLQVWWDADIAPSAPWEATIERELSSAGAVIVCWSPHAVASENVKSEARAAFRKGNLIQIFLSPCEPPLFFGERQGMDLAGWNGSANDSRFVALAAGVRAVLRGEHPHIAPAPAAAGKSRIASIALGVAMFIGAGAAAAFVLQRNNAAVSPLAQFEGSWSVAGDCTAPLLIAAQANAILMTSGDGAEKVEEVRPALPGGSDGWVRVGGEDGNVLELRREGPALHMRAQGDASSQTAFQPCE